jgi:hypothetical protein
MAERRRQIVVQDLSRVEYDIAQQGTSNRNNNLRDHGWQFEKWWGNSPDIRALYESFVQLAREAAGTHKGSKMCQCTRRTETSVMLVLF